MASGNWNWRVGLTTLAIAILAVTTSCSAALAQDDFFEDIEVSITQEQRGSDTANWSVTGWVREKIGYALDDPVPLFSRGSDGLNRVESIGYARFDWQLSESTAARLSARASADAIYRIEGRDHYHPEEIEKLERRAEIRDLYVESQINADWYVKMGQQIIPWGHSENLRVVDLVNTQDQYTLGQQDLEDLRLPVPAIRVSYNYADWVIDSVVTIKAGHDDFAPPFNEFDQLADLRAQGFNLDKRKPENRFEYFARASTRYSHGDIAFFAADVNANGFDIRAISFLDPTPTISLAQNRFQAVGLSSNWTRGSLLLYGDAGIHFDQRLQPDSQLLMAFADGWPRRNQFLGSLGVEHNGFPRWILSAEFNYRYTLDHDDFLFAEPRETGYSVRARWSDARDRLTALAVWNQLPGNGGGLARFSVMYDWTDRVELGLLWVDYQLDDAEGPLSNFRNNDVVQFLFTYNFQH